MEAIAFMPTSLFRLSQFSVANEWFTQYGLPKEAAGLKRVIVGEVVYLIDVNIDTDEGPIIVINLIGPDAVFVPDGISTSILERIITVCTLGLHK